MDRVMGCIVRTCVTLIIALAFAEPGSAFAAIAKIYWAGEDRIQRADPDGGNIEDFVVGNDFNSLRAIALDAIGGKMYWATIRLSFNCCNFLWRANFDGTAVEQLPVDVVNGHSIGDIALDPVGGKIYWTQGGIYRANLDGTVVENVVPYSGHIAAGIDIDSMHNKIYWVNASSASIQRANLDGSTVETLVTLSFNGVGLSDRPRGITLDVQGGKMYFTHLGFGDGRNQGIGRADLDGGHGESLYVDGVVPLPITLDVEEGKMYWGELGGSIKRANLDGTAVETIVMPSIPPIGIALLLQEKEQITTIHPRVGGDTGSVTMRIFGSGFAEGAAVKLAREGESDIVGTPVTVGERGTIITTTFDLAGKVRGAWDVVVTHPDGVSIILPEGFIVEEGRAADLWVDIVGLNLIRAGRAQTFHIFYGNRGNVDSSGAFVSVAFSKSVTWVVGDDQPLAGTSSTANESILTFAVAHIPASAQGVLQFTLTVPGNPSFVGQKFTIRARKLPFDSLVGSPALTATPASAGIALALSPIRGLFFPRLFDGCPQPLWLPQSCPGCVSSLADYQTRLALARAAAGTYQAAIVVWLVTSETLAVEVAEGIAVTTLIAGLAPIIVKAAGVTGVTGVATWEVTVSLWLGALHDLWVASRSQDPFAVNAAAVNALRSKLEVELANQRILNSAGYVINSKLVKYFQEFLLKLDIVVGVVQAVITHWDDWKEALDRMNAERNAFIEQNAHLCNAADAFISCGDFVCQEGPSTTPVNPEPGDPDSDDSQEVVEIVTSFDPNDKVGSQGTGEEHFLSGAEPLRYAVFFENLETATAPAQEVVITDQLDTENMDFNTLSLGPITFGNKQVIPPFGLSTYVTDVDLRPDNNLIVRIMTSLNPISGLLTWRFTSVDPATGKLPDDPLAGFLPPNVNPPEGDGNVLFTVMPKAGLSTGTEIRNQAEIIFDVNEPIVTPAWLNTLDNTKPTSQVVQLAATQNTASFAVQWTGNDAGAGIGLHHFRL